MASVHNYSFFSYFKFPASCLQEKISLRIIVKTRMNKDDCYLGLTNAGDIRRPIYCDRLSWSHGVHLEVDKLYDFTLSGVDYQTALPHRNQDLGTNKKPDVVDEGNSNFNLYDTLLPWAVTLIPVPEKYVDEGTDCPSAFVLNADNARLYRNYYKKARVEIGGLDLPYTGYDFVDGLTIDENVLVVVGYGRPYAGDAKQYNPMRCYLLALRIVQAQ